MRTSPRPPGPAAMTSSIAAISRAGPPPSGPQANWISLLLMLNRLPVLGKVEDLLAPAPDVLIGAVDQLEFKNVARAAPADVEAEDVAFRQGSGKILRATTKPPPPWKSKSRRIALPRRPRSCEIANCACPEAIAFQPDEFLECVQHFPVHVAHPLLLT